MSNSIDMVGSQNIQADQYEFPYHYIPEPGEAGFLSRHWRFAPSYLAALHLVAAELSKAGQRSNEHVHLDVGCGDGALINMVCRLPAMERTRFIGIDLDERAISWARQFNTGTEFICGSLFDLSDRFHTVSAIEVMEHIPPAELERFVEALRAVLADDGTLVVTVPSTQKPVADKHYQHFDIELLKRVLEPCFSVVDVSCFERESRLSRLLNRFRQNRFFALDSPVLNRVLIRQYQELYQTPEACGRLLAICKP